MRDKLLVQAKRIVIKIGSSLIASRAEGLRPQQIERLADEIATFRAQGREILVVSSGAIVSGIRKLELKDYPKSLPVKQAAAAVGQSRLMWAYEKAFEHLNIQVAQILLTHQDLAMRMIPWRLTKSGSATTTPSRAKWLTLPMRTCW
jgi:glutamate 5-kinase